MIQNLHTHTVFCDGKSTPEEMVLSAIDKGFKSLGFSGHSYVPFDLDYCMNPAETEEYKKEVLRLKEKYLGRLKIYLGTELDMNSDIDLSGYDYIIGAYHYFDLGGGKFAPVDGSVKENTALINEYFGADAMNFARAYYEKLASLPEKGKIDIIAHFDLVTKNIERMPLFDASSKEYLDLAFDAIHSLKGKIPFFEVNTGAISRGYRTTPYPFLNIAKEFKSQGFCAVISSDCHEKSMLDCGYALARELLLAAGYSEQYILTDGGFCAVSL